MTVRTIDEAIAWQRAASAANAEARSGGLEALRANNARLMASRGEPAADVEVTAVDAGGVPAIWIERDTEPGPVILYLHAGGMVVGGTADSVELLGRLLALSGGRALAIEFRLAPEHGWPAPVEDTVAAYDWLLAEGFDPARIVVVGESGGGALAAAAMLALRDKGAPLPAAWVLLSPLVDFELTSGSFDENAENDPFVAREGLEGIVEIFLAGQDRREASPINAELAGLPPLLIQVGSSESLRDDGPRFAAKAREEGVAAEVEVWPQMIHLWHGFPELPEAVAATERIADFIGGSVSR
jgi:acetyl esterase/lipase